MKIRANDTWESDKTESIVEFTERHLDGSDWDSGALEQTQRATRDIANAFGRLLETLAEQRVLTAPTVTYIVEGYENTDAEFTGP